MWVEKQEAAAKKTTKAKLVAINYNLKRQRHRRKSEIILKRH